MNGSPPAFTSRAPSPRSASDSRKRGASRDVEHGRVKLHELHVGDARARAIRQRDAVAGRHFGIRRFREHLTRTACREQRRAPERAARLAARIDEAHADDIVRLR